MCKMSVWAWHCNAPQGGYLFYGNTHRGLPPFHFGGIENIMCGEHLVSEHTRKMLEKDAYILQWNAWFPGYRVKPKLITIEMRPADPATISRRKKQEGGAK